MIEDLIRQKHKTLVKEKGLDREYPVVCQKCSSERYEIKYLEDKIGVKCKECGFYVKVRDIKGENALPRALSYFMVEYYTVEDLISTFEKLTGREAPKHMWGIW